MKNPTLLCVLDGFGLNPNPKANAVAMARKPTIDRLMATQPHSTLCTFGERVGLPDGQMGNSEVGHMNIGAGRVVDQWQLRITKALTGARLLEAAPYRRFLDKSRAASSVHILGLLSDGGVHSHIEHLKLLIQRVVQDVEVPIRLHLVTDGRDTAPESAVGYVENIQSFIEAFPTVSIASIVGRFFAMDRDKRWERVERAYRAIAEQRAPRVENIAQYLQKSYRDGITDEFIEPAIFDGCNLQAEDSFIFWNFRSDRMREIVQALCLPEFSEFARSVPGLAPEQVLCFSQYDRNFRLPFLFELDPIDKHLGQVVSEQGLTQLRVAETEKYPHVTYFFNGGVENPYAGEDRHVVPSPRDVKTYDLKPEMSAPQVCEAVCKAVREGRHDLIVVNFANCDMVGHTGVLEAAIKAVETVDGCLGTILKTYEEVHGAGNIKAVIIADHGNAEQMIDYRDGTPHTSHTLHPVPVIMGAPAGTRVSSGGALCDVAPTILKLLGLPQPREMTGKALI